MFLTNTLSLANPNIEMIEEPRIKLRGQRVLLRFKLYNLTYIIVWFYGLQVTRKCEC